MKTLINFKTLAFLLFVCTNLSATAYNQDNNDEGSCNEDKNVQNYNYFSFGPPVDCIITRAEHFEETHDTYGSENFTLNPPKTRRLYIPPYIKINGEVLETITEIDELVIDNQPFVSMHNILRVIKNNDLKRITIIGYLDRVVDLVLAIPLSADLDIHNCHKITTEWLDYRRKKHGEFLEQQQEEQEEIQRKKPRSGSF